MFKQLNGITYNVRNIQFKLRHNTSGMLELNEAETIIKLSEGFTDFMKK